MTQPSTQQGDQYGGLPLPLLAPSPGSEVGDPSVSIILGFAKAVLNAHAQAAYSAVVPAISGLMTQPQPLANPVVRNAFARDPNEEQFAESDLPAVYVWRKDGERPYWMAEDYRVAEDQMVLLYIFQPAPQATRTLVRSFANGVVKVIDRAIENMRDPAYIAPGDPDPTAATTLANLSAVKVAVASNVAAQSYAGGALDGVIGGQTFAPAQLPTVTVAGVAGSGVVTFLGLGADGNLRVSRVVLSGSGTFAGDFHLTQIQQISVPPQLAGGTLRFGLYGFVGLGTQVLILGDIRLRNAEGRQDPISALMKLEIAKWRQSPFKIDMATGSPSRHYPHAVEITLSTQERLYRFGPGPSPAVMVQIPTASPPAPGTATNEDLRETALFE